MPNEIMEKQINKIKQKLSNSSLLLGDMITDIDEKLNIIVIWYEDQIKQLQEELVSANKENAHKNRSIKKYEILFNAAEEKLDKLGHTFFEKEQNQIYEKYLKKQKAKDKAKLK